MDCVNDFLEVFLSPRSCGLFLMQSLQRTRRSQAFDIDFRLCPLRTYLSPDSLNLLMILCTVDDRVFKVFTHYLESECSRFGEPGKQSERGNKFAGMFGRPVPPAKATRTAHFSTSKTNQTYKYIGNLSKCTSLLLQTCYMHWVHIT